MQIERFNMLNFIGLLLFNATVLLFAATQPINASTISLDLKNYVYQATPNGKMLCQSDGQLCLFGYWNTLTEFQYVYSNGIHDYISRTTGPGNRMGVIRSAAGGVLRCFSNGSNFCTAPPNSSIFPESLPEQFDTNVVPWATELGAENSNGTPKTHIQGAVNFQSGNYEYFGVQKMNLSTCTQSYLGNVGVLIEVIFVKAVEFGGSIGIMDALVVDEYELGASAAENHVERYFYVHGYGRVREASSYYNPDDGLYDKPLSGNSVRNSIQNVTLASPLECPQGSAPL